MTCRAAKGWGFWWRAGLFYKPWVFCVAINGGFEPKLTLFCDCEKLTKNAVRRTDAP